METPKKQISVDSSLDFDAELEFSDLNPRGCSTQQSAYLIFSIAAIAPVSFRVEGLLRNGKTTQRFSAFHHLPVQGGETNGHDRLLWCDSRHTDMVQG